MADVDGSIVQGSIVFVFVFVFLDVFQGAQSAILLILGSSGFQKHLTTITLVCHCLGGEEIIL